MIATLPAPPSPASGGASQAAFQNIMYAEVACGVEHLALVWLHFSDCFS